MHRRRLRSSRAVVPAIAGGITLALALISSATAQTVTFDLALDNTFKINIEDVHAGEAPVQSRDLQAYLIDIEMVNGVSDPFSSIAFSVEFEEYAVEGSNTSYSIVPLENVSSGHSGEAGTASSGIPSGGIGADRAGQVRYLFDNYYQGSSLGDWSRSNAPDNPNIPDHAQGGGGAPDTLAFQLAVWEIAHDSDLDLDPTDGDFWIDRTGNTGTRRTGALSLAQTWLDEIAAMGIGASYLSGVWEVHALQSTDDADLLYASLLPPPVPEPSIALFLFCASGLLARRRRP